MLSKNMITQKDSTTSTVSKSGLSMALVDASTPRFSDFHSSFKPNLTETAQI